MIPDALVRIQFGGIRRERHEVQAPGSGEQLPNRIAPMDPGIVQQDDQMPADLQQEVPQEPRHVLGKDIVFVELAVQGAMEAPGADRDAGDGGDPVVAIAVAQDGRLAHRAPGLADRGDQKEAGFVGKDDMGSQPDDVFFTAGQTVRFHSAIAGSLRSKARRSGF